MDGSSGGLERNSVALDAVSGSGRDRYLPVGTPAESQRPRKPQSGRKRWERRRLAVHGAKLRM